MVRPVSHPAPPRADRPAKTWADARSYFLFHATLIPVHCLRHNSKHPLAADWRAQVRSSVSVMGAMTDLSPNSSKCRDISLRLCWPHLGEDEERTQVYGDGGAGAPFTAPPNMGEGEAASMMNGYDAWCQLMSNTGGGGLPTTYQWPSVDDQTLNFFYQ